MAKTDDELREFVRDALARNIPREQIEETLLQAGWPQARITDALRGYAEIDFPIPVPRPKPYLSARETFLYLILFTTLYISAYNLGSLLFEFIEMAFPDPATVSRSGASDYKIRWAVSALIVAFPIFLWVSRIVRRTVESDPVGRSSMVRRWLTYLTLFIAASVLIGDLITLVYNLLAGELTVRFLLKALSVGLIAGGIFGYYLQGLRREESEA